LLIEHRCRIVLLELKEAERKTPFFGKKTITIHLKNALEKKMNSGSTLFDLDQKLELEF